MKQGVKQKTPNKKLSNQEFNTPLSWSIDI